MRRASSAIAWADPSWSGDIGEQRERDDLANPTSAASGVRCRSWESAEERIPAKTLGPGVEKRLCALHVMHTLQRDGGQRCECIDVPPLFRHEQEPRVVGLLAMSTPRVRIGARSGRYRYLLPAKVSVPAPASCPLS